MKPRYPLYIVSKSRSDIAHTPRFFDSIKLDYKIVIEQQQYDDYAKYFDKKKLVVLDRSFQDKYETCDDLGQTKSVGSGPARNFAWHHSQEMGHEWHWVMDDNIKLFGRLHNNMRLRVGDGSIFYAMEEFCLRYKDVAMAGPQYWNFAMPRQKHKPFITGTRIFSCNLIRNDIGLKWRGRYNEDVILSLDILKEGWQTILFYAFLQYKLHTNKWKGGNTEAFYAQEGTWNKSDMLVKVHPDVARHSYKFGRHHHHVDYSQWRNKPLIRRDDYHEENVAFDYGIEPTNIPSSWSKKQKTLAFELQPQEK